MSRSASTVSNGSVRSFAEDPAALAFVEKLRARDPRIDPLSAVPEVNPARIPRHVAMIMDGNGRWAEQSGRPRLFGHHSGTETVRTVVKEALKLGVEQVTLYAFSTENWRRPTAEVSGLMELCAAYCTGEAPLLLEENVRVRVIGDLEPMPREVREGLSGLERATRLCTGVTMCLAVNYGGRQEIVRAVRRIAERVGRGELGVGAIDEAAIEAELDTAGMPEPDLLIRTGGDSRVSNYMLWQISYAEIHVTSTLWPDFGCEDFRAAVRDFASRERRFGGLAGAAPVGGS